MICRATSDLAQKIAAGNFSGRFAQFHRRYKRVWMQMNEVLTACLARVPSQPDRKASGSLKN
jgi:hypothetical protein